MSRIGLYEFRLYNAEYFASGLLHHRPDLVIAMLYIFIHRMRMIQRAIGGTGDHSGENQ